MCARTKTSYSCGHGQKSSDQCHDVECTGLKKVHYISRLKCPTCKEEAVPHPKGRKENPRPGLSAARGRIISRSNSAKRFSPSSSLEDFTGASTIGTSPMSFDISGGASPWAAPTHQEKSWETPHRKQADEAWLSEHEDRISGLQASVSQLSLYQHDGSSTSSRRHATDYDIDQGSESDALTEDCSLGLPNRSVMEMRKEAVDDDSNQPSYSDGPQYRQRERQHSRDSLPDSVPSFHSSPLPRNYTNVQHFPAPVQEYDYYASHRFATPVRATIKPHAGGAKTEPYVYSPIGPCGGRAVGPRDPLSESPLPMPRQPVFVPSPHDGHPKYYRPSDYMSKSALPVTKPFARYHPRY